MKTLKTMFALMTAILLILPVAAQDKSSKATSPQTTITAPLDTHTGSSTAATTESAFSGLFTPEVIRGMIGTVVFFLLALVLFAVAYKVIDLITPGNLSAELLGTNRPNGTPNYALGGVVGAMVLGISIIIAAAIH